MRPNSWRNARQSATSYLGAINARHPFREGDGRAQRGLFAYLASAAGYTLA
jgi:fido (protein-threonine AMPylation protein)